jgi:hypothetical protein
MGRQRAIRSKIVDMLWITKSSQPLLKGILITKIDMFISVIKAE